MLDRNLKVAAICASVFAGMVGLTYASVPLYRLFCQVTGYGGTTQRAAEAPGQIIDRTITVQFDANTGSALPWTFAPAQHAMDVKLGEQHMAFYRATNNSDHAVTGQAVYNVSPDAAAAYFSKIQCFCFTQQTLEPGQTVDMPVVFFVDPKLNEDKDLYKVTTITLSYTFYPQAENKVSAADKAKASVN